MQLNYGLLPKRSDPPTLDFWNFWDTFLQADFFFELFGAFFLVVFHQNQDKKVPKNFWIWSDPPPFSSQNSKMVGAQKVSQNFWIAFDPPPPLWKKSIIKLHFFLGSSLSTKYFYIFWQLEKLCSRHYRGGPVKKKKKQYQSLQNQICWVPQACIEE